MELVESAQRRGLALLGVILVIGSVLVGALVWRPLEPDLQREQHPLQTMTVPQSPPPPIDYEPSTIPASPPPPPPATVSAPPIAAPAAPGVPLARPEEAASGATPTA